MSDKGNNITALINDDGMTPSQLLALVMDDVDDIENIVMVIQGKDGYASISYSAQAPGDMIIASTVLQKRVMNILEDVSEERE